MFRKWSSVWEIYPFKAGKTKPSAVPCWMSSFTHDNAFAFQTKVHLFVSPSRQTNTKFCTSESFWSITTMPARRQGDQFRSDPSTQQCCHGRRRSEIQKRTNLANKQATYQTSLFPMTDRKSTILNSFLIRPTYQISHFGKNAAICRSCV